MNLILIYHSLDPNLMSLKLRVVNLIMNELLLLVVDYWLRLLKLLRRSWIITALTLSLYKLESLGLGILRLALRLLKHLLLKLLLN